MSIDWSETARRILDPRLPIFNEVVERAVEQSVIADLDFDLECEARHVTYEHDKVAFVLTAACTNRSGFVCQNYHAHVMAALAAEPDAKCNCGSPVALHWSWLPIAADR